MSPSIWTQCGGRSNARPLAGRAWRVVEAQHIVSTRKLVASADEQALLEELIDRAKPPSPRGAEFRGLHYLLATPFRFPPLPHGSRFATRHEPSLWYGARRVETALAEVAYYRLLFLEGTRAPLARLTVELSAFSAAYRARRGVDLTSGPFTAFRGAIASPTGYEASQRLGREMRADGIEAFRYPSARDPANAPAVALFTPRAFAGKQPAGFETWYCVTERGGVEFSRIDFLRPRRLALPREGFEVDGRLPSPAL